MDLQAMATVIVRPGDTLIVAFRHSMNAAEAERVTRLIVDGLPDSVQVKTIDNVLALGVVKAS